MAEIDANALRDVEIRRLAELAGLAFRNIMDESLKMKTREDWYQKYTNAVLALNQLLKDAQFKEYEKRLRILEESGRILRRTIFQPITVRTATTSKTSGVKLHRGNLSQMREVG